MAMVFSIWQKKTQSNQIIDVQLHAKLCWKRTLKSFGYTKFSR